MIRASRARSYKLQSTKLITNAKSVVSKVEKNFHALFWIEALQSRRQKPKQKTNMASNANSKKNPKAPLVREQNEYAKNFYASEAEMAIRRMSLFPHWNSFTSAIFERVNQKGLDDKSIKPEEIAMLYAQATRPGYDYTNKRDELIKDVNDWKNSELIKDDLFVFTKHFQQTLTRQLEQQKKEILQEVDPRISELEKRSREQQNTIISLQEKVRYQDEVAREIVVTAPEPPWDLTQSNMQVKKQVANALKNLYTLADLTPEMVESVTPCQKSQKGELRYTIHFVTINIKQEICFRAQHDDTWKDKIRQGLSPDVRKDQVRKFPYDMAAAMYNYESVKNGHPCYARVEKDRKSGKYVVRTYASHQKQVSRIAAMAKADKIERPRNFVEEEHRKLLPAFSGISAQQQGRTHY